MLLLGLLQVLPAPPAPHGFSVRDDPAGSARVLWSADSRGVTSAVGYLRERLRALAAYFDAAPMLSGAIADEHDQHVQAFFSTALQRQPVTGILAVETTPRGASFSAILDRPQSLAGSLARLAPQLPEFQLATAATGGSALPPMQQVMLADGSATIQLPVGWRLTAGQKGSCDVAGPAGETLSLGAAAPVWTTPMARMSGLFVAPYSDPVTALRVLSPQIEAGLARIGQPAPRLVRIIESQPTAAPVGQAALILYESALSGRRLLSLALVLTSVTGPQQWLFYYSGASAPAEQFARELPLLRAIWNSFSVTPGELQRRMDDAIKNMNETWSMLRSAQANATRASLSAAEGWDQVIRGVQTIENRSGFRAEVPNDRAQKWVERLNETGTGHWRVVPASELVKP
ncbi:MAG TPA: hypothetical protein VGQ69_15370 [Gemmatimonadales bacterium]|nr:hypothetical protein [Gemmatimonadales bacterium]